MAHTCDENAKARLKGDQKIKTNVSIQTVFFFLFTPCKETQKTRAISHKLHECSKSFNNDLRALSELYSLNVILQPKPQSLASPSPALSHRPTLNSFIHSTGCARFTAENSSKVCNVGLMCLFYRHKMFDYHFTTAE